MKIISLKKPLQIGLCNKAVGYINDEIHAKTLVQTIIIPFFSLSGIVKDEIKIVVQQTINGHKLIGLLAHARVKTFT